MLSILITHLRVWSLAILWISGLSAHEVLMDSGATQTISSPVLATSYVWKLNGGFIADQTTRTFTYAPIRKDVGIHWQKLEATLLSGAKSEHHWRLRVRIPLPSSTLNCYVASDGSDFEANTDSDSDGLNNLMESHPARPRASAIRTPSRHRKLICQHLIRHRIYTIP